MRREKRFLLRKKRSIIRREKSESFSFNDERFSFNERKTKRFFLQTRTSSFTREKKRVLRRKSGRALKCEERDERGEKSLGCRSKCGALSVCLCVVPKSKTGLNSLF